MCTNNVCGKQNKKLLPHRQHKSECYVFKFQSASYTNSFHLLLCNVVWIFGYISKWDKEQIKKKREIEDAVNSYIRVWFYFKVLDHYLKG